MYSNKLKVGDIIVVSGFRPSAGTSTAAAMIASTMAARGEKVLLLTLDSDQPFDGPSLLSNDTVDCHLDEMIVLENSNGLNDGNVEDYVSFVTPELGYTRASAKVARITKDPSRTMCHIMDIACYQFRYVILDMGFANIVDPTPYYNKAALVVSLLTQDGKSVQAAKNFFKADQFGEDKFVVPVIADFMEDLSCDDAFYEKQLKHDCVFAMNHDPAVYDACAKRDIANFVYKNMKLKNNGGKSLFGKKKQTDGEVEGLNPTVAAYDVICDKIAEALVHEEDA